MADAVPYTYFYSFPDSSNLDCIHYDLNTQRLYVRFLNGTLAGYSGVTANTVDGLVEASSSGRFYNANIRGKFTGINTNEIEQFKSRAIGYPLVDEATLFDAKDYTKNTTISTNTSNSFIYVPPTPPVRNYKVRGFVTVEDEFDAHSPEQAIAAFKEIYGDEAVVKEVVISFE